MSEIKTIKCLPHFTGLHCKDGKDKALYKFSWPQIDSDLDVKIHLNHIGPYKDSICRTAFYGKCKEGELVVAIDTNRNFGINLENGELVMVYPEGYDFEIDSNGYLIMKKMI